MAISQNQRWQRRILLFPLLVIFLAANTGCKKGKDGPQGPPGTANVKYSNWFTPDKFQAATVFGVIHLSYDKAVADITQPVIDSGAVLTFGKLEGYTTTIWPTGATAQLPIAVVYKIGGNANTDTWSTILKPGNLRIDLTSTANAYANDAAISHAHQFRYIIIPGGQKITGLSGNRSISFRRAEDVSQLSYAEICRALNIPE